ncbi:aldose epimerase family protein [Parendozoicomonas haliclonae]|uniref:Aldose 1-epimerase n=1 Tax=Parendozoicomonas haliclonae TaxID=1960125 RepID=A0A1X7AM27_9GAMM|nr:aldose epimerase family protein [Parendozoicomonas haliclonae]SMA48725.1 Aldose 1-epimerase precursor [Parendozoicomonas haliclonae]
MSSLSMKVEQSLFGRTTAGEDVTRTVLTNDQGMKVALIDYGATIQAIHCPDQNGQSENIVLSCDSLEDYERQSVYLGAVVGRCANRIAKGRLELEGQTYQLTINNDPNHLHGGENGFHTKVWEQSIEEYDDAISVTMTCTSPDGEDGYPGHVQARVIYTLTSDNILDIRFSATTNKTTVVNLTQHSYFNLAGSGTIHNHVLQLDAPEYLPIDENAIPTGQIQPVQSSAFDFIHPKAIGQDIAGISSSGLCQQQLALANGYDHTFCLPYDGQSETRRMGEVWEPSSGRTLTIYTNQPGVQLYTGNYLEGTPAPEGKVWHNQEGFCLETQGWPDASNQPNFPAITLQPGEIYQHHTCWIFGCRSQ